MSEPETSEKLLGFVHHLVFVLIKVYDAAISCLRSKQFGWRRKKKRHFKLEVGFVSKKDILIVLMLS